MVKHTLKVVFQGIRLQNSSFSIQNSWFVMQNSSVLRQTDPVVSAAAQPDLVNSSCFDEKAINIGQNILMFQHKNNFSKIIVFML